VNEPEYEGFQVQIVHLKELMEVEKEVLLNRLDAMDKAVAVYESNMHEWKIGHNEWRKSLEDSRRDSLSRSELNSKFEALTARLDAHEKLLNQGQGRDNGYNNSWLIVTVILGLIISALLVVVEMKK
jgi:hypothetical protein